MIVVLLVAAVITALIGETKDTLVILAIVVFNGIVGFVQEYRAEQAMDALKRMSSPDARVVRDGQVRLVPAGQVVPGDVLLLEQGDIVTADLRLVEAPALRVNEAPLTGESEPVSKVTHALPELPDGQPRRPAQHGLQRHRGDLRPCARHRRGHRHGHRHRPHRRAPAAGRRRSPRRSSGGSASWAAGWPARRSSSAPSSSSAASLRGEDPPGDVPHRREPRCGRHPRGPAGRRDHLAGPRRAPHGPAAALWCAACRPWRRSAR